MDESSAMAQNEGAAAGSQNDMAQNAAGSSAMAQNEGPAAAFTSDRSRRCRLCAKEFERLVPIFHGDKDKDQLGMKIETHVPFLAVQVDDTLPVHVCCKCAAFLNEWDRFSVRCQAAKGKLVEIQTNAQPEANYDNPQPGTSGLQNHTRGLKRKLDQEKQILASKRVQVVNEERVQEVNEERVPEVNEERVQEVNEEAVQVINLDTDEDEDEDGDEDEDEEEERYNLTDKTLVYQAAGWGYLKLLHYFANKRVPLNTVDEYGNTPLHHAAIRDQPSTARFLLDIGLDINAPNNRGLNAMQEAAQKGSCRVLGLFFRRNPPIAVTYSTDDTHLQRNTHLLCAAFAGSFESAQILVAMGASVSHRNDNYKTAAWVAMNRQNYDLMDWLLLQEGGEGDSPFHVACFNGYLEIVSFILRSRGCNLEAKDRYGRTPLKLATVVNHVEVVKLLLENGASVEGRDRDGETALHIATANGNTTTMNLLLRHGARVSATDDKGLTSLHCAIHTERDVDVLNLLLQHNHRPRDKLSKAGRAGVNQLVAVAIKGDLDAVRQMLTTFNQEREQMSKVNFINMQDTIGWTVLHFLAYLKHLDVVSYLISQGSNPQILDGKERSALNLMARHKHLDELRISLESIDNMSNRAAAVNNPGWLGESVLMQGIRSGSVPCVDILIRVGGGKLTQRNASGRTPLMIATLHNYIPVIKYLLRIFDERREGMSLKDYIKMKNNYGDTVLDCGHIETNKFLKDYLARLGLVDVY